MKVIEVSDAKEKIQKEFKKALNDFIKDESYFKEYDKFTPLGNKVLVKVFKFVPSEDVQSELGHSQILIQGAIDGKWKPSSVAMAEKIFPIVKIIKKGKAIEDNDIQEGGVYTVPFDEITGEAWNPDFLHLMNSFTQKAGNQGQLANVPKDMEQRLPKIQIDWQRYKFSMPDRLGKETDDDKLVYLIPSIKLESVYK